MSTPDRYAVAGHPVAHSQSPFIHAAFAAQTGQDLCYERLLCPLDGFATTLREFAAGGARGCNVTVPFKFEALALASELSPRARLAAAVNTLRFDAEGWLGENTDGAGLVADIERHAGLPLRGLRVLLLGAGGASAGVLGSLIAAGPAELKLLNRSQNKAQALVQRHDEWAMQHGVRLSAGGLEAAPGQFDVLINGTSASLAGAGSPLPDSAGQVLARGGLALDMMYGAAARAFLDWAADQGGPQAKLRDGLGMLVEQAAEAFWIWRGVRPDTPSVLAALRQRLDTPA
jgi:shikimate dehydrogenase